MLSEFELVVQQQSTRLTRVLQDGEMLHPSGGRIVHYYAFIIGKVNPYFVEEAYKNRKEPDSYQIVPFLPERITSNCRVFIPEVISTKETRRKPEQGDIALFVTKDHWFGERIAVMLYPPIKTTAETHL